MKAAHIESTMEKKTEVTKRDRAAEATKMSTTQAPDSEASNEKNTATFGAEEASEELLTSRAPKSDIKNAKRYGAQRRKERKSAETKSSASGGGNQSIKSKNAHCGTTSLKGSSSDRAARRSARREARASSRREEDDEAGTGQRASSIMDSSNTRTAKRRLAQRSKFGSSGGSGVTTSSDGGAVEEVQSDSFEEDELVDMNVVEFRQPNRRIVKAQRTSGNTQPGAFAHRDRDAEASAAFTLNESEAPAQVSVEEENSYAGGVQVTDVYAATAGDAPKNMDASKKSRRRAYVIAGVVLVLVIAVGAGVGVSVSGSGSTNAAPTLVMPTPAPTEGEEYSTMEIEEECSKSTTGTFNTLVPEWLVQRRDDLVSRLPSNLGVSVPGDGSDCSAENLSLLSVALHATSEDSATTLSNRLGLSLLFYATDGREWDNGKDWVSSGPHCEWEGVSCNETSPGNVTQLDMQGFNLNGPLPSRIMSLLPAVSSLYFNENYLTGTLPPEFHRLSELAVGTNELNGTLAAAFFESTTLRAVDLSLNMELVVSPVPFIGTQWIFLDLGGTTIKGDILSSVSLLSNLVSLGLDDVSLTGTIPTEIGRMINLQTLNLQHNSFLGGTIPSELQNLLKLQNLFLSGLALTGTVPSELGQLTELKDLLVDGNALVGEMPTELGLLTKLTRLLFFDNNFEGMIPSQICSLKIDGTLKDLGNTEELDSKCAAYYGGLDCPTDLPECCTAECRGL